MRRMQRVWKERRERRQQVEELCRAAAEAGYVIHDSELERLLREGVKAGVVVEVTPAKSPVFYGLGISEMFN